MTNQLYSAIGSIDRKREILERYETIISYFAENPERAANATNSRVLEALYDDQILRRDKNLFETLRQKVLNHPNVRSFRVFSKIESLGK